MSSTTTQTRRFLFQLLRSSWHPDTTCVVCIIMFFLILILYFDAAHLNRPLVAFIPSRFRISLCLSSSHTVGIIFYNPLAIHACIPIVPVPMSLGRILSRLKTNYYTSMESILGDLHLISENCLLYNSPECKLLS